MELSKRVRNSNGRHSHQVHAWEGNSTDALLGILSIFRGDAFVGTDETVIVVTWLPIAECWRIIVTDINAYDIFSIEPSVRLVT